MRIPKIDYVDNKFWINIFEKIVSMVMLIYIAFHIRSFLQKQISVRWSRLTTVHLRLANKLTTWSDKFSNLNGFAVMHAYVTLRLPLAIILVKPVEISRRIVQKHALRRQAIQHFRRFELRDGLEKATFLLTVYYMQGLLTYRTEVCQKLHAEATREKRFIRCLAHFEEELDAVVFALPGQDIRVTLYHYDIDKIKSLKQEGCFVSF